MAKYIDFLNIELFKNTFILPKMMEQSMTEIHKVPEVNTTP